MVQDESRKVGSIDVDAIRGLLHVDEIGFVTTPEVASLTGQGGPLDMHRISDRFAYGLSKRGGDMYGRVRAIDERVTKNSRRPEGSTPVRGSGVVKFGLEVGLGADEREAEKLGAKLQHRSQLIIQDQQRNYNTMVEQFEAADDARSKCIGDCEMHQLLTGGGYDNTSPVDYYGTIWNFVRRSESLPSLDDHMREAVVRNCILMRDNLIEHGFRVGSLKPTPFVQVRVDQQQNSKDGTMGWPILKRSLLPFTEDEAIAIRSQYDIDLSELVGAEVDDGFGYKGPARCADAVAKLISEYDYTPSNMLPLIVLFQRIQRHGWKELSAGAIAKDGKARAIYVPDVVWGGGVGAMVMDAFQRALEEHHVPNFPSLMKPEDQVAAVFNMVSKAASEDCIVLSVDESGYDQSLRSDVIATIFEICVRPFFEEEYQPYVDVALLSVIFKVLVTDSEQFNAVPKMGNENLLSNSVTRNGHLLIPLARGGLLSGLKGTMWIGSLYNIIVVQWSNGDLLMISPSEELKKLDVAAGDDVGSIAARAGFKSITSDDVYGAVAAGLEKFGIEVNVGKQFWVCVDDEPVCQFLQKIYHSGLDIQGVGSAARVLQQVDFSEYPPAHLNVAEQALAQISVMENGWNNPFIDTAVKTWLASDPKLTYLFQTFGDEAFNYLTRSARMDDPIIVQSILNLETKGANGLQRSAGDAATDIKLHIVPLITKAASSLPPSNERWVNPEPASRDQHVNTPEGVIDAGADESVGESEDEV